MAVRSAPSLVRRSEYPPSLATPPGTVTRQSAANAATCDAQGGATVSDDAEGFKDAPLSPLAFVVFSHSVKTFEDCFLGRFLPSLLVREPRLAAVREELDGMFSAPSGKSLPVPGERSLAFATTRLPASSGSVNTRSKLGLPAPPREPAARRVQSSS